MHEVWRTLKWSSWLGWQIESNWTRPWLFATYVIIKPLAGSMTLVCMFYAARSATAGAVPAAFMPYLYVSNACYFLVGAVTFGLSWTVIADREHYRMLKYIFISPAHFRAFFVGRGLAKALQALLGAVIILGIGTLVFPEIRTVLSREQIAWSWLIGYLALGVIMLTALGLIIASILLNMARHGMFLSEGIAGVMYLVCGVVFPISVLPSWLQTISLSLPPTYWLEGMRRSLMGDPATQATSLRSALSAWSHVELMAALLISTTILVTVSEWVYRIAGHQAWKRDRIEKTTGV